MVSIEHGREVCKKALHLQVKIPSDIAVYYQKRFGLTILLPDIFLLVHNIHHCRYLPLEPY